MNMTASDLKLTQKQEAFAVACVAPGEDGKSRSASDAYRKAYDASNMSASTVNRAAKELMDNPKIAARIAELRAPVIAKARITVEDLLKELEEARVMAMEEKTPAPAVSATMGKAKLLGYDKQILEHHGPNGAPLIPSMIVLCAPGDDASQG